MDLGAFCFISCRKHCFSFPSPLTLIIYFYGLHQRMTLLIFKRWLLTGNCILRTLTINLTWSQSTFKLNPNLFSLEIGINKCHLSMSRDRFIRKSKHYHLNNMSKQIIKMAVILLHTLKVQISYLFSSYLLLWGESGGIRFLSVWTTGWK